MPAQTLPPNALPANALAPDALPANTLHAEVLHAKAPATQAAKLHRHVLQRQSLQVLRHMRLVLCLRPCKRQLHLLLSFPQAMQTLLPNRGRGFQLRMRRLLRLLRLLRHELLQLHHWI